MCILCAQLLHLRSSAGSGMETLKFVKYCFMAYNGNHEDADNQFSSFMGRSSKVPPGKFDVEQLCFNTLL